MGYEGLTDKRAYLNVIGCLLQDASLIDDIDRPLKQSDFNTESFYELLFVAIYNLYGQGCTTIDEFSIDSYLSNYKKQYSIFQDNRGIDYLVSAREMAVMDNYDYYYHRLRKYALLRYYESQGLDTRFIYDSTIVDANELEKEQIKFDNYTESNIIELVESTFVINPNMQYCTNALSTDVQAGEGMSNLIEELQQVPDVGMPLNNEGLNTVARGARFGCLYMRSCPQGGGKAIPNDTVIPTPDGYKRVGEIRVGDYLFDRQGRPTKVLNVFPQPTKKQVYILKLADGREAKCCEEHLWTYYDEHKKLRTESVKDILSRVEKSKYGFKSDKNRYKYALPVNKAVQYSEKEYSIPACSGSIRQRKEALHDLLSAIGYSHESKNRFSITLTPSLKTYICELCRGLGYTVFVDKDKLYNGMYRATIQKHKRLIEIVEIVPTEEYADMTCFTVDNSENLFLMNDYIVTHNTRLASADACNIAVPYIYDTEQKKYRYTGNSEPTTIFTTEMQIDEIQTILIATVSKVNEEHILYGTYEGDELERVQQAIKYIESSPLYIVHIPDFSIEDIKNQIKKYNREFSVRYFFFDYIHTSLRLMAEINSKSKTGLKEHQLLLVFATELKTIAQQLNVFIFTASQLNGEAQNAVYKDQNLLSGSKALANKLDMGVISMSPSPSEKKKIECILHKMVNVPEPNMCHWVYKVRRGRLTRIIIWTKVDLGTMTERCLFVTNYDFQLIDMDFTKIEQVEETIKEHSIPISQMAEQQEDGCEEPETEHKNWNW